METPTKAIVSVTEMARMLGLSRSRLYQLLGTKMPWPVYDLTSRRPVFTEELQKLCLEVRRRNCGIDGQPILFYACSPRTAQPQRPRSNTPRRAATVPASPASALNWLTDAISGLGLNVNATQTDATVRSIYPNGITGIDQGEVIRAVFLHCRRQNSAGNVGT